MHKLNKFLHEINLIRATFDKEKEDKRFNIFTALHKEHDEVRLHSRFISYLLSPTSGHGLKNKFAEIFIKEILKINENEFNLSGYEVIPNEENKSEFKDIDILIINKTTKQAIIIENKIYAKDSNRQKEKDDGYNGQLERYYNTIKTGFDKDGKSIFDFKCNTIHIYYLSMFKWKKPSDASIGQLQNLKTIYYEDEIKDWLYSSLNCITENKVLNEFVKQYINLIDMITNNNMPIEERIKLKEKVAENLEITRYLQNNFKHIKWHTAFDFWINLKSELEKHFENVRFYPNENEHEFNKVITEVTHNNKLLNHGVLFEVKSNELGYISGLDKLSWGTDNPKRWTDFKDNILENISFSDFTSTNTYQLINQKKMHIAIKKIVDEILEEQENDFQNLKKE